MQDDVVIGDSERAALYRQAKNINYQCDAHAFCRHYISVESGDSTGPAEHIYKVVCGICNFGGLKIHEAVLRNTSADPEKPVLDFSPLIEHLKTHRSKGLPQVLNCALVQYVRNCC